MKEDQLLTFLNNGDREELMGLPGIGAALADRLITTRPYNSIESVTTVRGINANLLEKLSDAIPEELPKLVEDEIDDFSLQTNLTDRGEEKLEEIAQVEESDEEQEQDAQANAKPQQETIQQPSARGDSLFISLAKGAMTALFAILITLGVLGSINGSLRYTTKPEQASLQGEIAQLSEQIDSHQEEIASLRSRVGTLEGIGERTVALAKAQEQLTSDLEETNNQLSSLQAELNGLDDRVSQAEEQTGRFETFLMDLNALLGNLFVSEGE